MPDEEMDGFCVAECGKTRIRWRRKGAYQLIRWLVPFASRCAQLPMLNTLCLARVRSND